MSYVAPARRSYLGEALLIDWADGLISAAGLLRLTKAAINDGLDLPMLIKIAESGDVHNAARGLKLLLEAGGVCENITTLNGSTYSGCILPSTVIKLIGRSEENFKMRLAPSKRECLEFWQDFFSTPEGLEYKKLHPVLKHRTALQLANCFVIKLHEDAGPYTKNSGVNIISWSSLFGRGTELETRYQSSKCVPPHKFAHSYD